MYKKHRETSQLMNSEVCSLVAPLQRDGSEALLGNTPLCSRVHLNRVAKIAEACARACRD
jgi:hypothetical protein